MPLILSGAGTEVQLSSDGLSPIESKTGKILKSET